MNIAKLLCFLLFFPSLLIAQSWQVLPNSPRGGYWNHDDIVFFDEQTGWVCDIGGRISKTEDGGDSWTKVIDQPGTSFRCLAFTTIDIGFVGNLGPGDWVGQTSDPTLMYKTIDGGETWTPVDNIPTTHDPKGICGMQAIDEQHVYAVGRYDGPAIFYKTEDGGDTWTTKDLNADNDAHGLIDLHFFSPEEGIVTGWTNQGSALWHTTDGGETFTKVASSYQQHVWKIYFRDRLNGYANISNYSNAAKRYLYTSDGGLTWDEGIYKTSGSYEGLGIAFIDENTGWCAGDDVTYETKDGGASFSPISIDPDYDDTINRFFKVSDSVIYAAGSRVYKLTFPDEVLGIKSASNIDNSLCQISSFPNPMTSSTQIKYTIPIEGNVVVAITGIGGREIEILIDKHQRAGTYTVEYNPDYDQKFVTCTISTGNYLRSVNILRRD